MNVPTRLRRTLSAIGILAVLASTSLATALPASAGTPPDRLDDNRGISTNAAVVSAALSLLLGFPVVVTGRSLAHPKIHNLYWDDNWDAHNPSAISTAAINDFTSKLVNSHWFDPAAQYGVGSASFTGSHGSTVLCGGDRPGSSVDFLLVLLYITCDAGLINDGVPIIQGLPLLNGVPSPDDDSLYVLYLPTGTKVTSIAGIQSCNNFGAYHFMTVVPEVKLVFIPLPPFVIPIPVLQSFAFAVVPVDCATGGTLDALGPLASHEIIEGSTDPIFGLGWIDNSTLDLSNLRKIATQGEAADICQPRSATLSSGIVVTQYWSNAGGACVPAAPSTNLTTGSPSVALGATTFVTSATDITVQGSPPPGPARAGDTLVEHVRVFSAGTNPPPPFGTCPSPCVIHITGSDGPYTVEFFTDDVTNGVRDSTGARSFTLDNTPPESTLAIGAPQFPQGAGQPFVSSVTPFTLTATDAGVGVQSVSFRAFQQGGPVPAFTTRPGSFTTFNVFGPDGAYEVDTLATDRLGNVEATNVRLVTLDNTAPAITINQPAATQYVHSATLTLDYSVTDGTGSGVRSFTPLLDGATSVGGHGLASGQAIFLLTELTLGAHTFRIDAVDNVNNVSSASVTFTIIVTADSIKDDVNQFFQMGAITKAGIAQSLLAKLDAAARARDRGQCDTAANIYSAFIHELEAQSGKAVTATAAAIMIADAQFLIDHCP